MRQIQMHCFQWTYLEFMAPCNQSFIHLKFHLCLFLYQQRWDDTCSSRGLLIVWRCSAVAHSFNILIRSCLQSCFSSRLTLLKRRADYRDMAESSDNSRRLWQSSEQETWTMSLKQSRDGRGGGRGERGQMERGETWEGLRSLRREPGSVLLSWMWKLRNKIKERTMSLSKATRPIQV